MHERAQWEHRSQPQYTWTHLESLHLISWGWIVLFVLLGFGPMKSRQYIYQTTVFPQEVSELTENCDIRDKEDCTQTPWEFYLCKLFIFIGSGVNIWLLSSIQLLLSLLHYCYVHPPFPGVVLNCESPWWPTMNLNEFLPLFFSDSQESYSLVMYNTMHCVQNNTLYCKDFCFSLSNVQFNSWQEIFSKIASQDFVKMKIHLSYLLILVVPTFYNTYAWWSVVLRKSPILPHQ